MFEEMYICVKCFMKSNYINWLLLLRDSFKENLDDKIENKDVVCDNEFEIFMIFLMKHQKVI